MRIYHTLALKERFMKLLGFCGKSFFALSALSCALFAENYELNFMDESRSWNNESIWTPSGVPGASDNVTISATLSTAKEITVSDITEVGNITIDGLYIGARFYIGTSVSGSTIHGNLVIGDTYMVDDGIWRAAALRGKDHNLTIEGSIIFDADGESRNIDGADHISRPAFNLGGDWGSTVSGSIEVGKNAAVDSRTGLKTAILLDTSKSGVFQNLTIGVATNTEKGVVIHNVAQLNYEAGQTDTRLTLSKIGGYYICDQNISIGGVNGYGTLSTGITNVDADGNSVSGKTNLTFTNAAGVHTAFSGRLIRENDSYGDTIHITMDGQGKQTFKVQEVGSSSTVLQSVSVKNGVLEFSSPFNSGALSVEGGVFKAIDGGATFASATWSGGTFAFAAEPFLGGMADKISVEGKFVKAADGKIAIDFSGLDAESVLGATYDLISASAFEDAAGASLTVSDADEYFYALNLINAFADFSWNGNALQVTFSEVPEPAAFAVLIGAAALALAVRRRK